MERIALVDISLKSLHRFLNLPDHVKLLRVRQTWEQEQSGHFQILVESEDLPLAPTDIPRTTILIHQAWCEEHKRNVILNSELNKGDGSGS